MFSKRILLTVLLGIIILISMTNYAIAAGGSGGSGSPPPPVYTSASTSLSATNTSTYVYSDNLANMAQLTITFRNGIEPVENSEVDFYIHSSEPLLLGWVEDSIGNPLITLDGNTMASDIGQPLTADTDGNGQVVIKLGSNNLIDASIRLYNANGAIDGLLIGVTYVSFHPPEISELPFTVVPIADNIDHDKFDIVTELAERGTIYYIVVTADNVGQAPAEPAAIKEWASDSDTDPEGIIVYKDAIDTAGGIRHRQTVTGHFDLIPDTNYVAMIVAEDSHGNLTDIKTITVKTLEMRTAVNQNYSVLRSLVKAVNTTPYIYADDSDNLVVFTLTFKTHAGDFLVNSPVIFYIWTDQDELLGWVDSSNPLVNLEGNTMTSEAGQEIIINTDGNGKVIIKIGAESATSAIVRFYNSGVIDDRLLLDSSIINITVPPTASLTIGSNQITKNRNETITMDTPAVYQGGKVFVPFRAAADTYNLTTSYNASTQAISFTKGSKELTMFIGATGYVFNGTAKVMTVAPFIQSGRAMVPIEMIAEEFGYELEIIPAPSGGGGGGGGGGGAIKQTPPLTPAVHTGLMNPQTADDTKLNDALKQTGEAKLDLSANSEQKATISREIVRELVENNLPLTITNQNIAVAFSPNVLNNLPLEGQSGGVLELGAKVVTPAEKEQILASANLGASTGIFEIGGKIIDLSAVISAGAGAGSKVESFAEPVAVTVDLSDLNLTEEQVRELCGTRLEKDAAGNTVVVKLGGTYDAATKSFTFYTNQFSLYSVMQVKNLVTIDITIDIPLATVNGASKRIDVAPTIINSRTMVPLRFIGEAFGAEIDWREETRTVKITLNGKEVSMVVDQPAAGMDMPPIISNGRTLVPIRFISESLGADVMWNSFNKTISIVK